MISCWPPPNAVPVIPAATTAPVLVAATPEMVSAAALPSAGAWRQRAPSDDTKAVSDWPDWPASTAPSELPFIRPGVKPPGMVRVAANVQAVPLPERYTSAARTPLTVAGLTSKNPSAVVASSENWSCAPCPVGTVTARQLLPPSSLSQAPPVRTVTCRDPPLVTGVATSPAIRIRRPVAAASLMSSARPLPAGSRSRSAPSLLQLVPSEDKKITGVASAPSGMLAPAAMKPLPVRFSTVTWSPGSCGRPVADVSVQARPSALVQTESGPMAAHAPGPPATKRAACPGAGVPPPAADSVPRPHDRPSSGETKN